jgi:protein-L-isoaspartate(D-aspartate) O-methyltransferase
MSGTFHPDPFLRDRLAMVEEQLRRRDIRDQRLLAAMERIPRHEFIPRESWNVAYRDYPVSIGEGQTISQPYIVALMIGWLQVEATDRILEIGTGTGYQAAILAQLAADVVTVERQPRLADQARTNFERLGYRNLHVVVGDGSLGVPEFSPYQKIIVAAAAPSLPPALFDQLVEGGRLILPVGSRDVQVLQLVRKLEGKTLFSSLEGARFVPQVGKKGFPERDF